MCILSTNYKEEIPSSVIYKYLRKNIHRGNIIDGYDRIADKYIDLSKFKADYIFVSTPYDIYRPAEYSSSNLSKIAKLCTIEYGATIIKNNMENILLNNNFYKNCYYNFINSEKELSILKDEKYSKIREKFIPVGCIKLDKYLFHKINNNHWKKIFKNTSDNKLRIVWKPRWTLENIEQFFEFLENFIEYTNGSETELLLLEHPLLKSNLKNKGYLDKYNYFLQKSKENFKVYNDSEFLDYVLESDVLVGECTSLMSEYSITGNPIILVGNYNDLNDFGKELIYKNNTVNSFQQICRATA